MRIMNGQFPSIEQATEKYTRPASGRAEANGRRTFADILSDKKLEKEGTELKFSKLASHRLSDRNIELSFILSLVSYCILHSVKLLPRWPAGYACGHGWASCSIFF